jgi:hypothetical protein
MPSYLKTSLTKDMMKKFKPSVKVGVNVDTDPIGPPRTDWRKEEMKRCKAEIVALEKEIANFNAKDAAEKVKTALEIKLKLKKLRVQEHELNLDDGLIGY